MGYIFDALHRRGSRGTTQDSLSSGERPAPPVYSIQDHANGHPDGVSHGHPDPAMPRGSVAGHLALTEDLPEFEVEAQDVVINDKMVDDRLVAITEPAGLMAEEYRSIRTGLLARWQHKRHLIHTITSATPQEGKTITSLNLGLIFGELHSRRTLVIEADLRLPQFEKQMSLPRSPGLIGLLKGEAQLNDAVFGLDGRRLHVMPAGSKSGDRAVQLLSSTTMAALLKDLRQKYDHIIVDTPPVIDLADAGIVGAMSDDVLMIARMNRTPRTLIEQAVRTLANYNAPVAGVIATDQKRLRRRYFYYRYGYRYGYGYYQHQRSQRHHHQAA